MSSFSSEKSQVIVLVRKITSHRSVQKNHKSSFSSEKSQVIVLSKHRPPLRSRRNIFPPRPDSRKVRARRPADGTVGLTWTELSRRSASSFLTLKKPGFQTKRRVGICTRFLIHDIEEILEEFFRRCVEFMRCCLRNVFLNGAVDDKHSWSLLCSINDKS